jgi:hypothetical protein
MVMMWEVGGAQPEVKEGLGGMINSRVPGKSSQRPKTSSWTWTRVPVGKRVSMESMHSHPTSPRPRMETRPESERLFVAGRTAAGGRRQGWHQGPRTSSPASLRRATGSQGLTQTGATSPLGTIQGLGGRHMGEVVSEDHGKGRAGITQHAVADGMDGGPTTQRVARRNQRPA